MRPSERGIDVPAVGDRFRVGDVSILVEEVESQASRDWTMRTIVTGVDYNGEPVEVRFIPDKEFEDDA